MHTGNIAFTLPCLNSLTEEQLLKQLGAPETGEVTRLDGKPLGPGVPKYLVWPSCFPVSKAMLLNSIKVIDFGESFTRNVKPRTLHTPLAVRAPEVIFAEDIDFRVDLWSMGCMVIFTCFQETCISSYTTLQMFELVTGQLPFDSLMTTKEILVGQMIEFVGELPEEWQRKHALTKKEGRYTKSGMGFL